jgi:hypothetical protein
MTNKRFKCEEAHVFTVTKLSLLNKNIMAEGVILLSVLEILFMLNTSVEAGAVGARAA